MNQTIVLSRCTDERLTSGVIGQGFSIHKATSVSYKKCVKMIRATGSVPIHLSVCFSFYSFKKDFLGAYDVPDTSAMLSGNNREQNGQVALQFYIRFSH